MASTIDNTKPANNALVLSSVIRDLATAAKNDIENIQNNYAPKTYVDNSVVGLWDDRGSYDASSGVYPSTGGSGVGGAILKGDVWTANVAGTIGGISVAVGGCIRALADSPAQIGSNWSILTNSGALGYIPEDTTNKVETVTGNETSTDKYLSVKGTYDFVTALLGDEAALAIAIGNILYFVGCVIESSVATNPATLLGFGTWELFGVGRVTVCIDPSQTEFNTLGATGGAKTHTLDVTEIPSHNHGLTTFKYTTAGSQTGTPKILIDGTGSGMTQKSDNAGGGQAHNNLQPYTVVYRWKRTA